MKKYIYLLFSLVLCVSAQSQVLFERQPLDHIWLFGGSDIRMDFNYDPPRITMEDRLFNFHATNASICNGIGDLLFYTNGIRIANSGHQYLENGYRINPGPITESWIHTGSRISQGAIILPRSGTDNLFDLLYAEVLNTVFPNEEILPRVRRIYHALIDMNENEGQGIVIEKDFPVIIDTLDAGKLTACRHGNGRDWWIIIPYLNANEYHRFLLDN